MAKQRRRAARSPKPGARTKSEPVPERVEIPVTDPTEIARLERIFGFAEDEVATNATSRRRHDGVRRAPERIRSGCAGAGFGWGGAGTLPHDLIFAALCDRYRSTTNVARTMTLDELQAATGLSTEALQ